jgi:hypothetical protein
LGGRGGKGVVGAMLGNVKQLPRIRKKRTESGMFNMEQQEEGSTKS